MWKIYYIVINSYDERIMVANCFGKQYMKTITIYEHSQHFETYDEAFMFAQKTPKKKGYNVQTIGELTYETQK